MSIEEDIDLVHDAVLFDGRTRNCEAWRRLKVEREQLYAGLTAVQERCTALLNENRALKRLLADKVGGDDFERDRLLPPGR